LVLEITLYNRQRTAARRLNIPYWPSYAKIILLFARVTQIAAATNIQLSSID
jgi:hypothetical protein